MWRKIVHPSTPSSDSRSSAHGQGNSSERKWKEYFHSKLREGLKKSQSSTSLFWDWSKDVKDASSHPKKSK